MEVLLTVPEKQDVLFICTHNSARSQMAEGLLKAISGDLYVVSSAGTQPTGVHPFARRVLKEIGIDISGQRSKTLNEFMGREFDIVITLCDSARESCPIFPGKRIVHKGFLDPSSVKGAKEKKLEAFRKSRDELDEWVRAFFTSQ